ncbi:DUF1983 domain-containing protein (plasmid) [Skermanella sp. TT6]|uniref:DUF1983 domain-containing protein n=1 Tax=Skermanella cutis TaxID=2775420 RepID=A0ABX7BGQ2_9PROT|nr:phage tail protein [Skermanella sp. TT6]QQP93570.1 DUF1983 domain-containing protein [Skermanella sp. TT6]
MPPVAIGAVAGAVSYSVGTVIAGTTFYWGAMAASAALSAAMAGASMLLAPDATDFSSLAQDRTHTVRQAVAPRQVVYGQMRVGGPIVFINVHGDLGPDGKPTGVNKNKWLNLVIPLACHEVEEIGDIYLNDEKLDLGPDGIVNSGTYYFKGDWGGNNPLSSTWERGMVRVRKYRGAPGQVADQGLINETAYLPEEDRWTADCVGNNTAYIVVTMEWQQSIFQSGIPNITAIVKGKKVFDPRDGVTRYSDNAALCIRDYLLTKSKDGGIGALADELLDTSWSAQANICDELVPLADGSSERRYVLNGTIELSAANSPKNTAEAMLTACGGNLAYAGGKWRLLVGAYRTPSVTLTDNDFRGSVQIQTRTSRRDSFNAVKGIYTDPTNLFQPTDYPVVASDTFMAQDGGHRTFRELDLPFTTSASAAQRLAKMDLLKSRQPIVVSAQCKLTAFRLQVGDVVMVTRERQGWINKAFEVTEWRLAVDGEAGIGVDLTLRETSPEAYDWQTSEEQTVDPAPNSQLPDWRNVPEVTNLSVDSSNSQVIEGSDGGLISRALVTWTAPGDVFVDSFEIQWKLAGDANWTYSATSTSTSYSIDNLPVGLVIDVRVRARNSLGVYGNFVTILGHQIAGYSGRANPAVVNLKVVGSAAGAPGVFNTRDVTFAWDNTSIGPVLFDRYIVEIRDATTNALRRSVETRDNTYTYLFDDNQRDSLKRSFVVSVRVRNKLGALSAATTLTATNPPPGLPTAVSLAGNFRSISLRYTPPSDLDFEGILVWVGTATNFVRDAASLRYQGPDTFIVLDAAPGQTYYIRYACFDAFGVDGVTQSSEQTVATIKISHADLVEELIDKTNLVPALYDRVELIPILETRISTEETTRQTAIETLSQRVDTISAQTGSKTYRQAAAPTSGMNAGDLWFDTDDSNKVYRYSGSAWQLTDDTRISGNAAAIQTETTARINAVSTLASQVTTIQTEVDGHTTAIQESASSIDGLEAQYTVKIDNNGHVSGFGLASNSRTGTPVSAFVVNADKFALAKPTAGLTNPVIPFIVDTSSTPPVLSFTGVISADQVQSGTIDTETLFIGGSNLVLDGPSKTIKVKNGTTDVVKMGLLSGTTNYGIEIRGTDGALVLSSGTGVPAAKVSGLGGLATKDTVGGAEIVAGRGINMLYNADPVLGSTDGWKTSDNSTGRVVTLGINPDANNTIPGAGVLFWSIPTAATSGTAFTIANDGQSGFRYPVIAGRRYEAHALMGIYRAAYVHISIYFFNATGGLTGSFHGNQITNTSQFVRLNQLGQSSVFATAPANSVTASIRFWCQCNTGTNPYGIATRAYFGEATAAQTELSPWSPGPMPVSAAGVNGLGDLAIMDSVNWDVVGGKPVFGSFATLSQITQSNASTFIGAAAIGSAHISLLTADKLAAGNLRTDTFLSANNGVVVLDGREGGRLTMNDPRTGRNRVWIGHKSLQDYGFWLNAYDGTEIFGMSGLNGAYIRDLSVDTLKIASEAVLVPRSATTTTARVGNGTFQQVLQFPIVMKQPGRLIMLVSLSQSFPGGNRNWTVRGQIYKSDGTNYLVDRWGGAWNDAIALSGDTLCPAGTHTCVVWWLAQDSTVRFNQANMVVLGAMR